MPPGILSRLLSHRCSVMLESAIPTSFDFISVKRSKVRHCPWLCMIRYMQFCSPIILKFSTAFEIASHCQTDCQVELLLFGNLCLFCATSWSCIPLTLLVLRRWHMENYLRYAHFRTKADYKRVSLVLAAHSEEQKSNSRLSTIPTLAAVHASIKMQFPQGPLQALLIGLHAGWNYGMIIRSFHCFWRMQLGSFACRWSVLKELLGILWADSPFDSLTFPRSFQTWPTFRAPLTSLLEFIDLNSRLFTVCYANGL